MLNIFVDLLCLKYGFCKKSLLKDVTLTSWTLFSSLFFQITYKTHISIVRSKLFRRSAEFTDKERHRDILEFLYHYDLSCFITLHKVKLLAHLIDQISEVGTGYIFCLSFNSIPTRVGILPSLYSLAPQTFCIFRRHCIYLGHPHSLMRIL